MNVQLFILFSGFHFVMEISDLSHCCLISDNSITYTLKCINDLYILV